MDLVVETHDLKRSYMQGAGEVHALNGVNFHLEKGAFAALMGPSGSGKSTLLHLVGALDSPTSGSLVVDGHKLHEMTPAQRSDLRRTRLGFIFQAYNLIEVLSAVENAEFVLMLQGVPAKERRERARAALASVGLSGLEDRRPNQLSGGQQQRVAVARAIAPDPAIVLADEPTANLDSHAAHALIELMAELNTRQGTTVLFATHDPNVMAAARRVITLTDGRITADETR